MDGVEKKRHTGSVPQSIYFPGPGTPIVSIAGLDNPACPYIVCAFRHDDNLFCFTAAAAMFCNTYDVVSLSGNLMLLRRKGDFPNHVNPFEPKKEPKDAGTEGDAGNPQPVEAHG